MMQLASSHKRNDINIPKGGTLSINQHKKNYTVYIVSSITPELIYLPQTCITSYKCIYNAYEIPEEYLLSMSL